MSLNLGNMTIWPFPMFRTVLLTGMNVLNDAMRIYTSPNVQVWLFFLRRHSIYLSDDFKHTQQRTERYRLLNVLNWRFLLKRNLIHLPHRRLYTHATEDKSRKNNLRNALVRRCFLI